jgi:ABC-type uncharacterized transport system auxiliary subunit
MNRDVPRGTLSLRSLALIASLLALAACATAPEIRYYRIVVPPPASAAAAASPRLGVGQVQAAEPYRQERILYRSSPYRIQHYPADRWETAPADMVQEALIRYLQASGRFARVAAGKAGSADPRLDVRLVAFEEVDEGEHWFGEVQLDYEVVRGGGSLLSGTSRQRVAAEGRTVEAVVVALSRALTNALGEVADRTATALSSRP